MDLFFTRQINEAVDRAETQETGVADARAEIKLLKLDIERLLMITEALWVMLKEKQGYTDDDLINRVNEIDLRDGALDGRVAAQLSPTCPDCNRQQLVKHRPTCLYCGSVIPTDPFRR